MVIGPEDPNFRKDNRDVILKRKQQHDLWVQTKCPKEKLLTYRIGEGWEPICKFLNKPGIVWIILDVQLNSRHMQPLLIFSLVFRRS